MPPGARQATLMKETGWSKTRLNDDGVLVETENIDF